MSKFGDEFKAARAAGKKTFMFNGKPYTTRTDDDNKKDAAAKAKAKPVAPAMDDATSKAVTKNALAQAAIKGEQKPVKLADKVEPSRGRGMRNTGVTGGSNLAPKPVVKGPSAEEKAAAADKAAAKTKKAKADMEATKDRMSARREEKSGFKLFPKMAKGGSVRGDGCAVKGKTKGAMR